MTQKELQVKYTTSHFTNIPSLMHKIVYLKINYSKKKRTFAKLFS